MIDAILTDDFLATDERSIIPSLNSVLFSNPKHFFKTRNPKNSQDFLRIIRDSYDVLQLLKCATDQRTEGVTHVSVTLVGGVRWRLSDIVKMEMFQK